MNRIFNILWFEDNRSWYDVAKRKVDAIVKEHCLVPNIIKKEGGDFDEPEICSNDHDLLLIDYKLASGDTGEKIVSLIRRHNILTDTLFYSSDEETMIAAIQQVSPPIDGVYYHRRDIKVFPDKVKLLIDKIVKRTENLVNLRGFVLDDCSDFEVRTKDILNMVWEKFTEQQKELLENSVCRHINDPENRYRNCKNKVIKSKPFFLNAVNDNLFFTHSDRLYLLTKVIKIIKDSYGFTPDAKHCEFKKNYEEDISQYRNAFGHRKSTDSYIEISGEQIRIDTELHKKMRATLAQYDELIHKIEISIINIR